MRYDTPVFMQMITSGEYDPNTGDYEDEHVSETELMASVMDTGTETMQLVYGGLKQGSLTVHLQVDCQASLFQPTCRIITMIRLTGFESERRLIQLT